MAWPRIWFCLSNTCGSVWLNGVGQSRETDEIHDKDCVKEKFQLARVKYDGDDERDREVLVVGNCSINI